MVAELTGLGLDVKNSLLYGLCSFTARCAGVARVSPDLGSQRFGS
jgi:hypothetical protein